MTKILKQLNADLRSLQVDQLFSRHCLKSKQETPLFNFYLFFLLFQNLGERLGKVISFSNWNHLEHVNL